MEFIETINVKGVEYQLQATYDSQGNNIANTYAKFSEVQGAIQEAIGTLIDSAPDALNTLNEIAAALGDDANFAGTMVAELAKKADIATTYNKTEVDTMLDKTNANITSNVNTLSGEIIKKADKENTYTKNEVYTKSEVDSIANTKANASETYIKSELYTVSEIDSKFALKSELHEIPENVSTFTNDAGYLVADDIAHLAVADTVNTELNNKVDKVEGYSLMSDDNIAKVAALPNVDQYNEKMAELNVAIENMSTNVNQALNENNAQDLLIQANKEVLASKVNIEEGKGLSTNDYTDEDKNKLAELSTLIVELQGQLTTLSDNYDTLLEKVATLEEKVAILEGGGTSTE